MALFDKLKEMKQTFDEVKAGVQKGIKELNMSDEERRVLEEEKKTAKAEAARKAEEESAKEKAQIRERILNGDPDEEYLNYCYHIATEEEREELQAQMRKNYMQQASENTNCDKGAGDCFWQNEKFFCSCGEDVDCPKKKYVKKAQMGKIHAPEHIPHMKYLAQFEKRYDILDKEKYSYIYNRCGYLDYSESIRDFFRAFLPEHVGNVGARESDFFYEHGLGDDNPIMRIVYFVHEQTQGRIRPWIPDLITMYHEGIDLEQNFFNNVSLYDRNLRDFRYTVKILDAASNVVKMVETFANPEKVNVEALFNEDGTIKATGYGGPKEGFYGDEIYNIVSTWDEEE